MKKLNLILLLLLLTAAVGHSWTQIPPPAPAPPAPAADYSPERWKEYKFSEFGFSIKFPRPATKLFDVRNSDLDPLSPTKFVCRSASFISYEVAVRVLKERPKDNAEIEALFDTRAALAAKEFGSAEFTGVSHEGWLDLPSRYYEIETRGRRLRQLHVLSGLVLYTVSSVAVSNHGENVMGAADAYRSIAAPFISSFKLFPPETVQTSKIDENDVGSWKKFSSDEEGFSVEMPGVPEIKDTQVMNEIRQIKQTEYILQTARMAYGVVIQRYGLLPEDEASVSKVLDEWESGFTESSKAKIVDSRSLKKFGREAREIRVETATHVISARVFLTDGRLYSLAVTYDAGLETIRSEEQTIHAAEAKFFDSFEQFKPRNLREIEEALKKYPAEFFGKLNGSLYTNKYIGFSIELPEGWKFKGNEESGLLQQMGKDPSASENSESLKRFASQRMMLFVSSKKVMGMERNSSIAVVTDFNGEKIFDPLKGLLAAEALFEKQNGNKITKHPYTFKIGKKNVSSLEREWAIPNYGTIMQRLVVFVSGKYTVTMVYTGAEDEDLNIMEKSLRSIKIF